MKKILKKTFNRIGLDIRRVDKEFTQVHFDELLLEKIPSQPIIFDVGGNKGQSIKRFKNIFKNPVIHSFEPIKEEFDVMVKNFGKEKNIFLNNFALGDKIEEKEFNVTKDTSTSSFNSINIDSRWLKVRSNQNKVEPEHYITKKPIVKIDTVDNYCKNKLINRIDILKIDTQGYEDKVLQGSQETLKFNQVRSVITENMFDSVYGKYLSFSDIEKYLLPNNFRMIGIDLVNNNLFSGLVFDADVYYFNKNFYKI